jgi:ribosome biogenesis GTPase
MELTALGFDVWFEERAAGLLRPGRSLARVTTVDRGSCLVRNRDGELQAELAGKLRFSTESAVDLPCVGDWVCVQSHGSGGPVVIQAVVPRKTTLRRKNAGRAVEVQMIAANIDVALIVQSCAFDFNLARLDRYLVMVNEGGIEPWIVLTKTDLLPPDQLERILEQVRQTRPAARLLTVSNTTGVGLDELRALLVPGKTYCLLGSSGVGKTTLLNRLMRSDDFATSPVSESGEGVHTTARRQLLVLADGAMLVDTPGMRELGLLEASDGLDDAFAEIHAIAATCRFTDCTHIAEPGCAVRKATEDGSLSDDRYRSFLKLRKETEFHDLSTVEKRRKDKSFGRFIKSAKKSLKK